MALAAGAPATGAAHGSEGERDLPSFADRIVAWQRVHGRHGLPWQETRDAYRVWLSEIMLQQTQVATALPYYQRFVAEFPDVRALAEAPIERVLELWSGLGYYRRAHHLHAAARVVAARPDGRFPRDAAELAALPGIGRSTAAAIAAFAHGDCVPILDGNVKRVLARHRGIVGPTASPQVEKQLWAAAEGLVPERDIVNYTQGMMDLGATVCTRTRPKCRACPVADDCVALATDRVDELPSPRVQRRVPQRETRVLLIESGDGILFERRPPSGVWSGLLSLPEVPMHAEPVQAMRDRFGMSLASGEALAPIVHAFTHFTLTMHPLRMRCEPQHAALCTQSGGYTWLVREHALVAALPSPIRRLLRSLGSGAQACLPGIDRHRAADDSVLSSNG